MGHIFAHLPSGIEAIASVIGGECDFWSGAKSLKSWFKKRQIVLENGVF